MTKKQLSGLKAGDHVRLDSGKKRWRAHKDEVATIVIPSLIQWPSEAGRTLVLPGQMIEDFVLA